MKTLNMPLAAFGGLLHFEGVDANNTVGDHQGTVMISAEGLKVRRLSGDFIESLKSEIERTFHGNCTIAIEGDNRITSVFTCRIRGGSVRDKARFMRAVRSRLGDCIKHVEQGIDARSAFPKTA
ncbi:MAG: hypothetical protein Q8L64_04430 [bacterium]|nr:hypothetical protein [bacterium]